MLPIAQKSSPPAQPKQAPSMSSPSLPKSTGQVSQFQSSVHLNSASQSVEPSVPVNVKPSDYHFRVEPSVRETVEHSVSEMESTSVTQAVQPQIESNSVTVAAEASDPQIASYSVTVSRRNISLCSRRSVCP